MKKFHTNDDVKDAIRKAVKEFDERLALLWEVADVMFDHYSWLPEDRDLAKLAEHYRDSCDFTVGFAERQEGARLEFAKAVNAALAEAVPSSERQWQNLCVEFGCFDSEMSASWRGLEILLNHYDAHTPDNAEKLRQHYREMEAFAMDFVQKLQRKREMLGDQIEMSIPAQVRVSTAGELRPRYEGKTLTQHRHQRS